MPTDLPKSDRSCPSHSLYDRVRNKLDPDVTSDLKLLLEVRRGREFEGIVQGSRVREAGGGHAAHVAPLRPAGLLKPKQRSHAGYRLYPQRDFGRREQIVVLKFLRMPLTSSRRLKMQNSMDWAKKYYTPEAQAKMPPRHYTNCSPHKSCRCTTPNTFRC